MKLKALKPRLHNAMFHTHTVSGIVISFALFVCFYAGAVALFMDELYQWENPQARIDYVDPTTVDYDKVIKVVSENTTVFNKDLTFGMTPPTKANPLITFYGRDKDEQNNFSFFAATIHPITYEILSMGEEPNTHMARTIYELHYFHQIPVVGIYLSGFVAFFFLFAIFTGVLTHWKNIVNKFYAFTTEGKWKQIWTNGHISLGMITLPFQIIYAVTGALLGLSILLLAPSAFLMYNGDTSEVVKAVRPDAGIKYDDEALTLTEGTNFNTIYQKVSTEYPENDVTYIYATNYTKSDGTIGVRVDDYEGIAGDGIFVYGREDGKLKVGIQPEVRSYANGAYGVLIKLHYATYGGIFLKIIYFILAMITCYIIISGVMIWRTARDKPIYTDKQRRFHHRVTKFYLAITLSMFPALALIFLANMLVPMDWEGRVFPVNAIFFSGWLVFTLMGLFWNNYRQLNRNYLLMGSVLGLLIPIANGFVTGDWLWQSLMHKSYFVFSVDAAWLIIGIVGLLVCGYSLNRKSKKDIMQKVKVGAESERISSEAPAPVLQISAKEK